MPSGFSLNTMTLGGLVVALGVVVDDAVIDVENILRRRRAAGASRDMPLLFTSARSRCAGPVFYATAAVAVAFLPILMMSGMQGAFFRPLSIAFLLAVGLSLLVAMSATPALCVLSWGGTSRVPRPPFLRALQALGSVRTIEALAPRPRAGLAHRARQRASPASCCCRCSARACCRTFARTI